MHLPLSTSSDPNASGVDSAEWLQPPVEQEGLSRYVATLRERIWIIVAIVAITTRFAILYVLTADKGLRGAGRHGRSSRPRRPTSRWSTCR